MDHRRFFAALSHEQRRSLNATSDKAGLAHLAVHLLALCLTGTVIIWGGPLWWAALLPHGVLLVFLFTLQHEVSHRTVFSAQRANDLVGAVCGFVLINPATWFRYFHLAHHRHTNDPNHDPELQGEKPQNRAQFAWHVSGLPFWRSAFATLSGNAAGRVGHAYLPKGARHKVRGEALAHLAGYAVLAAGSFTMGSTALLWLWVIPALLGQPFLRLYLMAEHGRCPAVANMFENTRTTFTNAFLRRLAWNMPYHAEHHAIPTVPFHNLPRLHDLAQAHLVNTSDGYVDFHREGLETLSS